MGSGKPIGFIPDGYTLKFHIPGEAGVHPPLSGERRPILPLDRARAMDSWTRDERGDLKLGEILESAIPLIAEYVVSWDLEDPDGNPVEITEANTARVESRLLTKLQNVVLDLGGESDFDEEETAKN